MVKSAYFIIRQGNEIIKIPILCLNKVLVPQQLQFSRGTRNLFFKTMLHRTIFDASQRGNEIIKIPILCSSLCQ